MKKIILLFSTIFYVISLNASTLSMSEFRKIQREYVLSEFKALYKKRNISAHKAQLRHKYTRVKKISHSGILNNYHIQNENIKTPDITISEAADQTSMQSVANYNLQLIDKYHTQEQTHNSIPTDIPTKPTEIIDSSTATDNQNNFPNMDSDTGNKPDIPNQNIDNHSQIPKPVTEITSGGTTPVSHTETPSSTQKPPQNTQINGSNPVVSTTPSDTPSQVMDEVSDSHTENFDSFSAGSVRPMYANPWKRR